MSHLRRQFLRWEDQMPDIFRLKLGSSDAPAVLARIDPGNFEKQRFAVVRPGAVAALELNGDDVAVLELAEQIKPAAVLAHVGRDGVLAENSAAVVEPGNLDWKTDGYT